MAGDSLSVYAYYGTDRIRERKALVEHDIVLTTYGVVASESNQSVSTLYPYQVISVNEPVLGLESLYLSK